MCVCCVACCCKWHLARCARVCFVACPHTHPPTVLAVSDVSQELSNPPPHHSPAQPGPGPCQRPPQHPPVRAVLRRRRCQPAGGLAAGRRRPPGAAGRRRAAGGVDVRRDVGRRPPAGAAGARAGAAGGPSRRKATSPGGVHTPIMGCSLFHFAQTVV